MKIPDLIGIEKEDALKLLENFRESHNISIKETMSPFKSNECKKNECRVVRQQFFDNNIIITVSYF